MTKKTNVYPIKCQLVKKDGSQTVVDIIKLTSGGMLINSHAQPMKVADIYKAILVLPFKNDQVELEAVVYKTYDSFKGQHGLVNPGSHVSELTFKTIPQDTRKAIHAFLTTLQLTRV
jgi:hypothetical protein